MVDYYLKKTVLWAPYGEYSRQEKNKMKKFILISITFMNALVVLGSQADQNSVVIDPNYIIISNPEAVKNFLDTERIKYDEIWIPIEFDVSKLKIVLKEYLEKNSKGKTKTSTDNDYILGKLDKYKVEYSGYIKNSKKFIIFNMIGFESNLNGKEFTMILDGGCDVVRVIFDTENNNVISIECNGQA
ncbi:MAG: hypothetical protein NTW55_01240 [Planctomycetota bacterium]|nr:hypothetical protein [Planctomycetota bacterium]